MVTHAELDLLHHVPRLHFETSARGLLSFDWRPWALSFHRTGPGDPLQPPSSATTGRDLRQGLSERGPKGSDHPSRGSSWAAGDGAFLHLQAQLRQLRLGHSLVLGLALLVISHTASHNRAVHPQVLKRSHRTSRLSKCGIGG